MAQCYFAFLVLCGLLFPAIAAADARSPAATEVVSPAQPPASVEDRFLDGAGCLGRGDITCVKIALAGINPASPYAKILEAGIAAAHRDFDAVLRLLLPLEVENSLLPAAQASLHASLARAYENQGNALRALQHRCQAELYFSTEEEIAANQQQLWQAIQTLPRQTLLEMRGESPDSVVQGWIDLAASGRSASDLAQWRIAYPDHPAADSLLKAIAATGPSVLPSTASLQGKIALLLPLEIPAFSSAAKAVQSGVMAAARVANSKAAITSYPTAGHADSVVQAYRLALAEGADHVIGPLTREEVAALDDPELVAIPTLALNSSPQETSLPEKLLLFGLPVEEEARRLASRARSQGLQSATLVAAESPLAERMASAFAAAWGDEGGTVTQRIAFSPASNFAETAAQIAATPADMLFIAANPEQARLVRPHLDPSIPAYGLSHLFDGDGGHPLNTKLAAVHFVDMPWLLDPADPAFSAYREAAVAVPRGEMQRWFAVGVDAWNLLSAMQAGNRAMPLHGLSGTLTLQDNRVVREIPMAQFGKNGVFVEWAP